MNNVDIAEAMIECVKQAINKSRFDWPITWNDLLTALEDYIKNEQHEIEKLRKLKDKPFG